MPNKRENDNLTQCSHFNSAGPLNEEDILSKKDQGCEQCQFNGASRWLCLRKDCFYVGCGEKKENHAAKHAQLTHHELQMNLRNNRIWCHECQAEIRARWTDGERSRRSCARTESSMVTRSMVDKERKLDEVMNGSMEGREHPQAETRSEGDIEPRDAVSKRKLTSARRLIVPTPGPEMISVADENETKHDTATRNSIVSSATTVSNDSAIWMEKSDADVHARRFYVTQRPYHDRERPVAVVDTSLDNENTVKDEEPLGLTGLRNMGNTCYMNAALQALSNTVALTEYLLNCYPVSLALHNNERCLASDYSQLINEIWNDRRPACLIPYNVLSLVRLCHPSFRAYQQQDAQEFLRFFLDQLHDDLKQPVYAWECTGDDHHSSSRGRESNESTDENADTSSVASSASSGVGDGHSDDGAYRTCDSGCNSDQELIKRTTNLNEQLFDSPARRRAALSESLPSANTNQQTGLKNLANIGHRRLLSADMARNGAGAGDSSEFSDARQELSPQLSKRLCTGPVKRKALRYGSGVPRKKPVRFRSIISDIFDGKLLSSVQCLTCNTVSETKETFQDLSIPIPAREQVEALRTRAAAAAAAAVTASANGGNPVDEQQTQRNGWWKWFLSWFTWMGAWMTVSTITLEDCLAAFFSADDLKGDDMYSCEGCKKLRNGVKCCYLQQLPEVLCIHLKRFRHELMFSAKITTQVTFPLEGLDLRSFMHRDAVVPNGDCIYDLYAVICHHGGVEGGHYTAYCLNSRNDRWYEYDDQCVTEMDAYMVQSSSSAYVLFYRKRGDHIRGVREEIAHMLRRPKESISSFYMSQEWINRFNNFSHPGPITNFDFLCPHGCIEPKKHDFLSDLYAEVPSSVWQYLYKKYGGGPVCNKLLHCVDCNQYYRRLKARREDEFRTFNRIERSYERENKADSVYALSMKWYRKWEAFILGRQEEPPGPIDNSDIVAKKTEKNEFPRIRPGSNLIQLHREMWEFFYASYGGGPEILLTTMSSMGHGARTKSRESLSGQETACANIDEN